MAGSLRQNVFSIRWLFTRYNLRPYQHIRTLCKVPPKDPSKDEELDAVKREKEQIEEKLDAVKRAEERNDEKLDAVKRADESKESLDAVKSEERKEEKLDALKREEKESKDKLDAVKSEERAEEKIDAVKREKKSEESKSEGKPDKRSQTQHKLQNLISSLASTSFSPSESDVQLSRPKPRQKTAARGPKTPENDPQDPKIDPELAEATKQVAQALGGNAKATESELLSKLRLHATDSPSDKTSINIGDLFSGMNVEKEEQSSEQSRPRKQRTAGYSKPGYSKAEFSKAGFSRQNYRQEGSATRLLGAEPIGIFTKDFKVSESSQISYLKTWDNLLNEEVERSVTQQPENAFEEMIQWTNKGKLWTFPVDNEIGLEAEKSVGFHEHIFLERHISWCPNKGPIRHFMELVCTGLSKNPYLTVERKKAHIEWYRKYFSEKEQILKDIGAIQGAIDSKEQRKED